MNVPTALWKQALVIPAMLLACYSMFAQKAKKAAPVVIGYVGGYKGIVNTAIINARQLTHINYAFVNVKDQQAYLSNERTDTVNFRKLNLLKEQNPALRILISIGGWTWSGRFSDAVLSDSSRALFARSAVNIIRTYHLDGVDIDWEYPGRAGADGNVYRPEDKQNYTLLFRALRHELDLLEKETGSKKLLTTAVGGFTAFLNTTEMGKAQQYLDYINLMTYDFYSSDKAGHHTNLYASAIYNNGNDADKTVKAYQAAGVPASKLVMGIAFYGRVYTLANDSKNGLGDKMVAQRYGDGYSFIKDSIEDRKGFKKYQDKKAQAPYLFNADTHEFITYEDEASATSKCRYVTDHHMAGVMFWEYSEDPKGYLLRAINAALGK
jgi:chitinase